MINKLVLLRDEIEEKLANMGQLQDYLDKIKGENIEEEMARRVSASILDDFYMATERIFKIIARDIDYELPGGEDWHKKLLRQMSIELPEIRPVVIDKELFHQLEEYLRFRHLIRNIYGFQLEFECFKHLINRMPSLIKRIELQLMNFLDKMEEIADKLEE